MQLSTGSVVVITGAASGIGEGLARECVNRGYSVALADIEGPALQELKADLVADGGTVASSVVDVADPTAVFNFAETVHDELGVADLVIANAGVISPQAPLWKQRPEDWEWLWRVNLFGVVNTWTAFLPAMIERGTGHIVATSSIAGLAPGQSSGNTPYAATKYGIVALADNLRIELEEAAPDIEVTVLLPGPVKSRIWQASRNRPEVFGGPDTPRLPAIDSFPNRLEANEFATRVFDGLDRGERYLLPNEEFIEPIASHLEDIASLLRKSSSLIDLHYEN